MPHLPLGPIDQVAWIVDDLEGAVAFWEKGAGVGPWTLYRGVVLEGRLAGEAVTVGMDVALAARGTVQIELIRPTGSGPSPYLSAGAPMLGLHHIAWIVEDFAAALADAVAAGFEPWFEGSNEAVRVAYLTSPAMPGTRYELISGAGSRALLDQQIEAARRWQPG